MTSEYEFSAGEVRALADLRSSLRQVAEWPPDSPLAFVLMLAPRTRGKLGEMLLAQIARDAGLSVGKAESVAYDVRFGPARCEVKFSTEDPPRFQQVRDPREGGSTKYDFLVCISGRPHGLVYWLIHSQAVGELMDEGHVKRHKMVPSVSDGARCIRFVSRRLRGLRSVAEKDRKLEERFDRLAAVVGRAGG